MTQKLRRKGIPDDAAAEVLDRFTEVDLIDDASFAGAWVSSRQQRKGLSARALRAELQRKGVAPDVIAEALEPVDSDAEYAAALAFAQGRAPKVAGLGRATQWRRLAGALGRRGFGRGTVTAVLRQVLGESQD